MEKIQTDLFHKNWALVTAGNKDIYNTMTISWGEIGTIWNLPVCTVYVKPIRYTYEYMESNDYFTVSFYESEYKKDLGILGSKSGRDLDKVALTSLTPMEVNNSMSFEQASVTLVCKKIYFQDLDVSRVPQEYVDKYYLSEEAHRMYIGEIVEVIEK